MSHGRLRSGVLVALAFLLPFVAAGCGGHKNEMEAFRKDYPAGRKTTADAVLKDHGKPYRRVLADYGDAAFKASMESLYKGAGGVTDAQKAKMHWDKQVESWYYEVEHGYALVEFERQADGGLVVLGTSSVSQVDYDLQSYEKTI